MKDRFGSFLSLSNDGLCLAVSAPDEDSSDSGVEGNQALDDANDAGAVYLYRYEDGNWKTTAYIKSSNTDPDDAFGTSIAVSSDCERLAVGAPGEDSAAQAINGDQSDNSGAQAGAVYVY